MVASLQENQDLKEKLSQVTEENRLLRDLVNHQDGKLSLHLNELIQKSRKSGRPITEAQIDKVRVRIETLERQMA